MKKETRSNKPEFVNLTPHDIRVENCNTEIVTFPSQGVARLATKQSSTLVGEFSFSRTEYGAIEGLPEPIDGTIYIASMLVAQAAKRSDVVSPDSGPTAQRKDGQIEFVRGFITHA